MKFSFIIFLILLPLFGLGQNKYHDVVYLKNGSIVKGTITQRNNDGSITILLGGRQSVSFYKEEIAKIEKAGRTDISVKKNQADRKGYFCRTAMGVAFKKERNWQGPYTALYPSFQTVHGYQWSRFFQTGLGMGTDFYQEVITIPVFIHISGELFNTKVSPYYEIQFGDSFILSDKIWINNNSEINARGYFRVGGGIQINNATNSFYLGIGYKKNKVEFIDEWTSYYRKTSRLYRSLNVSFGMKF